MKRCSRCIMPETAKGIEFDEKGLCQLCQGYKKFIPKGDNELIKEIQPYINGNGKYNCVVPVSGGRDSSYALYYSKEVLGLKPIAVHNDNDFEAEIARKNLEIITKNLNVPLVRIGSKAQMSKKVVAEKFKMNVPFGPELVVYETCEACKYGFESAAYNVSRKEGIQLIIWGDSKDESTQPFHALTTHNESPSKWQRLLSGRIINVVKYKYYFGKMKKEYGPNSPEGLKEIHLYEYIEWDRKRIVETIQNRLGWSKPEESPTSWRIDCDLVPLVNYLTYKAYGVSKIELGFSNMIRSGKMDRNDALRKVKIIENSADVDYLKDFLRNIGVSNASLNKVLL